jgi:hypothetical protein
MTHHTLIPQIDVLEAHERQFQKRLWHIELNNPLNLFSHPSVTVPSFHSYHYGSIVTSTSYHRQPSYISTIPIATIPY